MTYYFKYEYIFERTGGGSHLRLVAFEQDLEEVHWTVYEIAEKKIVNGREDLVKRSLLRALRKRIDGRGPLKKRKTK